MSFPRLRCRPRLAHDGVLGVQAVGVVVVQVVRARVLLFGPQLVEMDHSA